MAVTSVTQVGSLREKAVATGRAQIFYVQTGQVWAAEKLRPAEFDEYHRQAIAEMMMAEGRRLVFPTPGWKSVWIGAGEEKAVYLVIDPQGRALALELLAKGTYLNGHLAEGHYFDEIYVPALTNHRWNSSSFFDHTFSGWVRVREFVYGDTLAGPGLRQAPVRPVNPLKKLVSLISWNWVRWVIAPRYVYFRKTYRDAHEANVMVELIPLDNPEGKSHYAVPVFWLEEDGHLHLRYYRLTPIDVRAR